MRMQGAQDALPTSGQLREDDAWSLLYAVRLHGPRNLARRLGYASTCTPTSSAVKPWALRSPPSQRSPAQRLGHVHAFDFNPCSALRACKPCAPKFSGCACPSVHLAMLQTLHRPVRSPRLTGPAAGAEAAIKCRLRGGRHPKGHWERFDNLAAGLVEFLQLQQRPHRALPAACGQGPAAQPQGAHQPAAAAFLQLASSAAIRRPACTATAPA